MSCGYARAEVKSAFINGNLISFLIQNRFAELLDSEATLLPEAAKIFPWLQLLHSH